ncbi:MAG: glycoside hydrolase family 43 protein [Fimbriimonas sp.]
MPLSYTNPVYPAYFADPFVFRHGDTYLAVGTGASDDPSRVCPMLRSDDLVNWEPLGACLVKLPEEYGSDYWAPEIAHSDGLFYLYYSVGFGDSRHHLRVATSEEATGPYADAASLTDSTLVAFAIDGSPFRDDDGEWYFYYATDFMDAVEGRPGTALVVDRLINMTQLAGQPKTVLRATRDWQRYQAGRTMYGNVWDWHTLEGPCVVKREGRYYCFYSGGNWQNDTYGVDFCVATHPCGPFVGADLDHPRVLKSVPGKVLGPGHNSVVTGPDGMTDYIVYHAWDTDATARRMCIDPLIWTPDGPRCAGPS